MTMPRTILFCLPSISRAGGGVSEAARLQALALATRPHAVVSVLTFHDEHFDRDLAAWRGIPVRAFRTFGPRSFSFAPGMLLALLRERRALVHVHGVWQFQCLAVYLWSLVTGGRYVVTPHGMLEKWIRARSPRLKWLVSNLYQNRFLRRASAFQVLTMREIEDVKDFRRTGQSVDVVPNYVAVFARDDHRPSWWRDEDEGRDVFLFLGRIHEKKGCLELCRAWEDVCASNPDFRDRSLLVFCGWIDGLPGFEDQVKALNARFGNAVFAGPQYGAGKQRSLSCASFFILPSKSEGLPMSVLEAWSALVPVLMTDECNLPEGFTRDAAIRTGPDRVAIAASLLQAAGLSGERRTTLQRNGLLLLQEKYSEESVRDALLRMYENASVSP